MKRGAAILCFPVLFGVAHGQDLRDPTQPPLPGSAAMAGAPAGEGGDGQVLQSIILSKGRRLATIGGKVYKAGDKVGNARLVSISPGEVSLVEAGRTRVLRLVPESAGKTHNDGNNRARPRAKVPDRSGEKG